MNIDIQPGFFDQKRAAEYLQITQPYLLTLEKRYGAAALGKTKLGRRAVRYSRVALDRFMESRQAGTEAR